MQISSRFTIAVHVLIGIETFKNDCKVTSELLASSVNVNPVVIRRLLQQLKRAGIVEVVRARLPSFIFFTRTGQRKSLRRTRAGR